MRNIGIGGAPLLKSSGTPTYYWVNDDSGYAAGNLYPLLQNTSGMEYAIYKGSETDAASAISKTNMKNGMNGFLSLLDTDFTNFTKMTICPLGRYTSVTLANRLAVAEALWEVAAENALAARGPESYDLDLGDADVHLTDAAYVTFATRLAQRQKAVMGLRSATGTLGPSMASASVAGSAVTVIITPDDDTDITVPSGAQKGFFVTDGGTPVTVNSITKNSATSITLNLASSPSGTVKVYCIPNGFALTNAEAIKGNGELSLPLQTGVVTAS